MLTILTAITIVSTALLIADSAKVFDRAVLRQRINRLVVSDAERAARRFVEGE